MKSSLSVATLLALVAAAGLFAQEQYPGPSDGQNQNPGAYQNRGQYQGQGSTEADPPSRVARLTYQKGAVSVQPSGSDQWSDAQANYPLVSGDRVYVDQGGRAELQSGQTAVRLGASADLTLTNLSQNYLQLGLAQGVVRLRTYGLEQGSTVELDTPNGAITVLRPGDIRVNSYTDDGGTIVTVNTGDIQVSGPELSQRVEPGQAVRLTGSNPVQLVNVAMSGYDDFDRWSISRDHHILNSESARYVSRDMIGYDDLDDNGSWATTPDYGPVWYPRAVPAGWVPYRDGHWAYVAPWGWTWVDDEPWGFAPFHYGRWAYYGDRWGWVPGPVGVFPVYSPALVAFVGGPHFGIGIGFGGGVSAWFPLGVGEPYVPWYRCSPGYVNRVNVTNVNIVNIHNTTVVNNYNTFINNTRTVNNVNKLRVNNIRYAHQGTAVTAVNARDFTSGRPVASSAVRVDPAQLRNAQVDNRPLGQVRPVAGAMQRPVAARPVPVPVARPTVLTKAGPAPAIPGARPVAPNRPLGEANNGRPAVNGFSSNRPVNAAAPATSISNRPAASSANGFTRPGTAPAAGTATPTGGQTGSNRPLITAPGAPNNNGGNRVPSLSPATGNAGRQPLPARDAQGRPAYQPGQPAATQGTQRSVPQAPVQQPRPEYQQQRPAPVQQPRPEYQQQRPAQVQQPRAEYQQQQRPAQVQQPRPEYQQQRPAPVQQPRPEYQQQRPVQVQQPRPEYQQQRPAPVQQERPAPAPREDRSAPKDDHPRR